MNYEPGEFAECIPCSAKPGSPQLCGPCLQNRKNASAIVQLLTIINSLETIAKLSREEFDK